MAYVDELIKLYSCKVISILKEIIWSNYFLHKLS